MINKEKYYRIAIERKKKVNTQFLETLKFSLKLNLFFFILMLLIFFIVARNSSNPENRNYPFWKLAILTFIYTSILSIISFIVSEKSLISRFRKLHRYKRDYQQLQNLLKTKQKFAFYLRDYKSGRSESTCYASLPGGNSGLQYVYGNSQMRTISRKINRFLPIVMLDNENEKTDNYSGILYYTTNDDWYDDFEFFAKKCLFIIIDYSLEFQHSLNIEAEINFILRNNLKIIVTAKSTHLNSILNRYPKLKDNLLFHIPVETVQTGPFMGRKEDAFNTATLPNEFKLYLKSIVLES